MCGLGIIGGVLRGQSANPEPRFTWKKRRVYVVHFNAEFVKFVVAARQTSVQQHIYFLKTLKLTAYN